MEVICQLEFSGCLKKNLVEGKVGSENWLRNAFLFLFSFVAGRRGQRDKCMFSMYIDANSVTNAKGNKGNNADNEGAATTGIGMEFTTRDFYQIESVQSQERLFRLIVGQVELDFFTGLFLRSGCTWNNFVVLFCLSDRFALPYMDTR